MAYYDKDDTIFAPATVAGTGAISVIRVSGPRAIEIADSIVTGGSIAEAKGYTVHFGSVYLPSGELLDEVLVSVFRAPHSYTGEDSVEISCHASSYIVNEVSVLLNAAGARAARAGEFTERAFLNSKMDLAQAEAVADVIASQNAAAHRIAISQMKGGVSNELAEMRSELLEIVSLMELELDFSEEDVEFADRNRLDGLLNKVITHIRRLADSFRLGNAIKNGIPTAIIGSTNVGKSTLLNALLGEDRAIVSDIHGTTRDTIEETLNIGGVLFRFIDTAGLRDSSETVEKIGIERTRKKTAEAEIVLGMIDGTASEEEIAAQTETILALTDTARQDVYILINKCDLINLSGISKNSLEIETLNDSPADQTWDSTNLFGDNITDLSGKNYLSTLSDKLNNLAKNVSPADQFENQKKEAKSNKVVSQGGGLDNLTTIGNSNADIGLICQNTPSTEGKTKENPQYNKKVRNLNYYVSLIENKGIRYYIISAKTGFGLDKLKDDLETSQKDKINNSESTTITNLRHFEALRSAEITLDRVRSGLHSAVPTDLLAQDIREAIATLGTIVGEISTDEILASIFSNFCIGK